MSRYNNFYIGELKRNNYLHTLENALLTGDVDLLDKILIHKRDKNIEMLSLIPIYDELNSGDYTSPIHTNSIRYLIRNSLIEMPQDIISILNDSEDTISLSMNTLILVFRMDAINIWNRQKKSINVYTLYGIYEYIHGRIARDILFNDKLLVYNVDEQDIYDILSTDNLSIAFRIDALSFSASRLYTSILDRYLTEDLLYSVLSENKLYPSGMDTSLCNYIDTIFPGEGTYLYDIWHRVENTVPNHIYDKYMEYAIISSNSILLEDIVSVYHTYDRQKYVSLIEKHHADTSKYMSII